MKNEFLVKRIESYMNEETPSNYALLLRGKWGCGKTFFCKSLIDKFDSDDVWYISAFGVKDKTDIDDKLFEAAHPIFSKNGGKHVSAIGYSLLRTVGKYKFDVDIDDIKQNVVSAIREDDGKRQCKLLFVDDVERSSMRMRDFMGYFFSLLEDGIHIVFVSNEDDINTSCEYEKYKEKLIGEIYEVEPDFHEIIKSFWEEEKLPNEKIFIDFLTSLYEEIGNKNLRILRQTLHQWKILYDTLQPKYQKEREFHFDLFKPYVVLKLQHKYAPSAFSSDENDENKKRELFCEKCQNAWVAFKNYNISFEKYRNELEIDKSEIKKSYTMDNIISPLPLADRWYDILVLGREADSSWIGQLIEDLHEKKTKQNEMKKEIHNSLEIMRKVAFYDAEDSPVNIQEAFETLCSDFQSGKYCSFGECMAFIQISLKLLHDEIIPNECRQNMKDILKEFITENGDKILFDSYFEPNESKIPKVSDPEIQRYINQLFDCGMKNFTAESESVFKDKIKFFDLIQNPNNALNKYLDFPILSKIDIDGLFQWLEGKNGMEMHYNLLRFLKHRYRYDIDNMDIRPIDFPDYDNVLKLRDKYRERYNELKGKYQPTVRVYKDFLNKYTALLEYMKKFAVNKNGNNQSIIPNSEK